MAAMWHMHKTDKWHSDSEISSLMAGNHFWMATRLPTFRPQFSTICCKTVIFATF